MRRGHNESNCLEEKANHPENCPHDVSFFPMAPNLTRIRGRSSEVPCLKLIVNGNIEHKSDCVAYCDGDNGDKDNLKFSAATPSTHHDQPHDWRCEGDRRERWQRMQIIDVNDLLELHKAGHSSPNGRMKVPASLQKAVRP